MSAISEQMEQVIQEREQLREAGAMLKFQLEGMTKSAMANGMELLRLQAAARAVVEARHYQGDDGWDRLKNAIADLEGIVKGQP